MNIAVVELIFGDNVVVEPVEVCLGEKLASEEARTAEALESTASRAGRARIGGDRLARGGRGEIPICHCGVICQSSFFRMAASLFGLPAEREKMMDCLR